MMTIGNVWRFAQMLALTGCSALTVSEPGVVVARSMSYDGVQYPFVVYLPTSYDAKTPMPAILLVHGAGGNGPAFLETWREMADSRGIILVAPTLDLGADAETRVPVAFPRIMDQVKAEWNVDVTRRYLFGYSAGGYFVYDAALLSANYFAAAAIFASVIQPDYDGIVAQAQRKTAIAIYRCDHDPYFTVTQGRRTRDLLVAAGMDVRYVELAGRDHDYGAAAQQVNADAWAFMSARAR